MNRPLEDRTFIKPHRVYDGGEKGCGVLIMGIAQEMHTLGPGEILGVHAYDPLANLDIPCWCIMTGHHLLTDASDTFTTIFYIRKEE